MIMNCYIIDIHINCCFILDNQIDDGFKYDLLEVGPLNMISWTLCLQYGLPHPTIWLSSQPSKMHVKTMAKAAVLQYWLDVLRTKASSLPSLRHLKTGYLGLMKCHPIFTTCGSSPWEVEKATTQARMISGRYRVEALTGHWVTWNREGWCSLPACWGKETNHKGTLESLLLSCPSLSETRADMLESSWLFLNNFPQISLLASTCFAMDPLQFLLDCSTMAPVISAVQRGGQGVLHPLFKVTRKFVILCTMPGWHSYPLNMYCVLIPTLMSSIICYVKTFHCQCSLCELFELNIGLDWIGHLVP